MVAEHEGIGVPAEPKAERRIVDAALEDDPSFERSLRPTTFEEFVGQAAEKDKLRIFVEAARARGEPLDHILLCGPPGLGKTTMAHILATELQSELVIAHGPAVEHKGQLASLLTKLEERDVLFIDEIHRLTPAVEENLYPAMEDLRIDVVHGDGPYASTFQLNLRPFTLVGATTRTGLLTSPLRSRFGYVMRMQYYPAEELARIVLRSASILETEVHEDAALAIAKRSRGAPRIANNLLRRVRDFAQVLSDGVIDRKLADDSLTRLGVDDQGLDAMDRRLLEVIIDFYKGGPVGIETLAAALSEPRDTLEDVYEPYLIQQGFLARTPRGRVATDRAFGHLGIKPPPRAQGSLF